jgi:APA family basic amino acid/polyamine antiporter
MTGHSRLIYGMASEGVFPRALTRIDPKRRTPWISVLLIGALACVACLIGEIEIVAYAGIIGSTFGTVVICICLILLRLREPELERPFRVPGSVRNIPIMTVLCAVISAIVIAMLPLVSWIPTLAIWLIGAIAYLLLRRRK